MKWWPTALAMVSLCVVGADARTVSKAPAWIASWGSAQMIADGGNALPADRAQAVTLRQIVRLSAGGDRLRVRLSNAFGTRPLAIGAGHVGLSTTAGTPQIDSGVALTFSGRSDALIAPGAELYSDPIAMPLAAGARLAISLYLSKAAAPQTGHPGARATSFTLAGNHVADPSLPGAVPVTHWYALADVEVAGRANAGTIVAIGDSITDGYGVAPDRDTRWTDVLAARLRSTAATRRIGVVNAGIGGNRILRDGLGPNLLARFDRDVIARSGVRWAIVLEGINDLGVLTREATATPAQHAAIVAQITAGYRDIVARAHAHGIRVIGGTVMPFGGNDYYYPGPSTEADRQAINAFIRGAGVFDAVVDFDRIMRDPAHPDRLAPALDSGDHLHPSEAGYRAMGEAVPLTLFDPTAQPVVGIGAPVPMVPRSHPTLAITFDDIPAHGPLPAGQTRVSVIRDIVRALADAKAPAFGFLNAGFGADDPAGAAKAIVAWRAAGLPLGNHTYSHANLDLVGAPAFAADIARNEAPLAVVARGADWHWFRYPFLAEGKTPVLRDSTRATLKARGYRIAAVTMSFDDYKWNPSYAQCSSLHKTAAIGALEASYLADARAAASAARARAQAQVGHDIPYVLLLHVGAFDARMLPKLLALYRTMGFRFVTLAEAAADPYYAAATDLARPGPSPSLAGPPTMPALSGPSADPCG